MSSESEILMDVWGARITRYEDLDGNYFVSLKDVEERGLVLLTEEQYRTRFVSNNELIRQFEIYMQKAARDFLDKNLFSFETTVIDQAINKSKILVFKNATTTVTKHLPKNISDETCSLDSSNEENHSNNIFYDIVQLKCNEINKVVVKYVKGDHNIFVSLYDNDTDNLLLSVHEYALTSNTIKPKQGLICACFYEKLWCRVAIINISTQILIRYIDFGNTAIVSVNETFKALSQELMKKPAEAINIKTDKNGPKFNVTVEKIINVKCLKKLPHAYVVKPFELEKLNNVTANAFSSNNQSSKPNQKKINKKFNNRSPKGKKSFADGDNSDTSQNSNNSNHKNSFQNKNKLQKLNFDLKPVDVAYRLNAPTTQNEFNNISPHSEKHKSPVRTFCERNQVKASLKEDTKTKTDAQVLRRPYNETKIEQNPPKNVIQSNSVKPEKSNVEQKVERKCVADILTSGVFYATEHLNNSTFIGYIISEDIQDILIALQEVENNSKPLDNPKIGDYVLIHYEDDIAEEKNWARAIIVSISNHDLQFYCAIVDYGKFFMADKVYPIPKNIKDLHEVSFVCATDPKTMETIMNSSGLSYVIETPGQCKIIVNNSEYIMKVELWDPVNKHSESALKEKSLPKPQEIFKILPPEIPLKVKDIVKIVKPDENRLFVKTKQCAIISKEIEKEIACATLEELRKPPEINQLVLCSQENDNLHRGVIKKVMGNQVMVYFIDIGEIAHIPVENLKNINQNLSLFECVIIKTKNLLGFKQNKFDSGMIECIMNFAKPKTTFEVVLNNDDEIDLVKVDDKISLSKILKDLGNLSFISSDVVKFEKFPFYSPDIGETSSLLCMCKDDLRNGIIAFCKSDPIIADILMNIEEQIILNHEKYPNQYKPSIMEICLAEFEGSFYRAVVTKITPNQRYTVYYIDYGNSSILTSDKLKCLPSELTRYPGIALWCKFEGLQLTAQNSMSDVQYRQFNDLLEVDGFYDVKIVNVEKNSNSISKYLINIPSIHKQLGYDGLL